MAKAAKKTRSPKQERRERRFFPQATASTAIVGAPLGAIGALAMGGGFWAQWGRVLFSTHEESLPFGWWLLAGGAVLVGAASGSGRAVIHCFAWAMQGWALSGPALWSAPRASHPEWHEVSSVTYAGDSASVVVRGHDETGVDLTVAARLKSQPQAAAWIVREARARVPGW